MILPVVALRSLVVLPKMVLHFDINRKKTIEAVHCSMMQKQKVFLTMQKDEREETPGFEDLYTYGVIANIKQLMRLPNQTYRVLAEGECRAKLVDLTQDDPFLEGEILSAPVLQTEYSDIEKEAMLRSLKEWCRSYAATEPNFGDTAMRSLQVIQTLEEYLDQLMIRFPAEPLQKQKFLNLDSTQMQFSMLAQLLQRETEIGQVKLDLQEKLKAQMEKNQREYMLREQIKVIRKELGEEDVDTEIDQLLEKAEALNAPQEVKDTIRRETERLRSLQHGQAESGVIRNYIDTLLAMPWNSCSEDNSDIAHAARILDEDHYGMEKIKERILEYLAVRAFSQDSQGSILCLAGPPGTGKTSIAQSVARALGKKYVRVCLGGVRDEAEIRGHRRTYIGSMPGRIAAGLKQAGTSNPLMLLDEIDKVGTDARGDTSSALLEVLDPEQNRRFADHYIELPIDLSRVLFIATANNVAAIPRPLLDRMELIEVDSYTENEKFHIGKDYLLPKQKKQNGLTGRQLSITDEALRRIIHHYTREAGVRMLERKLADICRKAARRLLEDSGRREIHVTEKNLTDFLGKEKVHFDPVNEEDDIGVVRGLAWTSVGGDTLEIEVNVMPGSGKIQLTGQMGDVMKESAQTGLSYIRSIAEDYSVESSYFEQHDIHIHIPEGAVPKDGPSAGITMATGMLSAITEHKVRADLAMTGEVTLRGRVLPIGGLKEKLLAAKMAGIHHVLVPLKNEPDVDELSKEITDGLDITYVSRMGEVIEQAFAES